MRKINKSHVFHKILILTVIFKLKFRKAVFACIIYFLHDVQLLVVMLPLHCFISHFLLFLPDVSDESVELAFLFCLFGRRVYFWSISSANI